MAKKRSKRMQVLEYIYDLRKDKLATKRYIADAEVKISQNEAATNYAPTPQDKPLFNVLDQYKNKTVLSQITQPEQYYPQPSFIPQIEPTLIEKPIFQQSQNNNLLYGGIFLLLIFVLKPFKRKK